METFEVECQTGIVYVINAPPTRLFRSPVFISLNGSDWLIVLKPLKMGDYPFVVLKFDENLEHRTTIDTDLLYDKLGNTLIIKQVRC